MPSFEVVPNAVTDAATRISSISGGVRKVHARLGACSGAAAGTPADDAVTGLLGQWNSVLPRFAAAADSLTFALGAAAQAYQTTDADVAAAADGSGSGAGGRVTITGAIKAVLVPRADRSKTPYPDLGPGSRAGPHGAIWARPGHFKPPAKRGYRIQGTGKGGWIYIPIRTGRMPSTGSGTTVIGGRPTSGSGTTVIE